jgi:hypothetical protein
VIFQFEANEFGILPSFVSKKKKYEPNKYSNKTEKKTNNESRRKIETNTVPKQEIKTNIIPKQEIKTTSY